MKFKLYTKPGCIFCNRAKDLLESTGHTYEEIDLSKDLEARKQLMDKYPFVKTVPQIFLLAEDGEKHIGGYIDLVDQMNTLTN